MANTYSKRTWNHELHKIEVHEETSDIKKKEYYYSGNKISLCDDPFINHIQEFLNGDRTVPVTKVPSITANYLFITFSVDMYQIFLNDFNKIQKPYECAGKYGFRGYSKGGKNGIFLLHKDKQLTTTVNSLIEKFKNEICMDLNCNYTDFTKLKRIKIVYHNTSGERVVGVMNENNNRSIFLGFASY